LLEIYVGRADGAHDLAAAVDPRELRPALIAPVRKHAVVRYRKIRRSGRVEGIDSGDDRKRLTLNPL